MGVPGDAVTVSVSKDAADPEGAHDDTSRRGVVLSTVTTARPVAADGFWRVCLTQPIPAKAVDVREGCAQLLRGRKLPTPNVPLSPLLHEAT